MENRYSFGGDEHLFVECHEHVAGAFSNLSMTNAVRDSQIKGVTEICPANLVQIEFVLRIAPDDILRSQAIESAASRTDPVIATRIIKIPVFYQDPWTHETLMRFRERHQDQATDQNTRPGSTTFTVDDFIAAHAGRHGSL